MLEVVLKGPGGSVHVLKNEKTVGTGGPEGQVPLPQILADKLTLSQPGGGSRLCPPQYYLPPAPCVEKGFTRKFPKAGLAQVGIFFTLRLFV